VDYGCFAAIHTWQMVIPHATLAYLSGAYFLSVSGERRVPETLGRCGTRRGEEMQIGTVGSETTWHRLTNFKKAANVEKNLKAV
jgi:hypothetical protein